jgi:hypothetical protein
MSKRKGLSLEEKRLKVLEVFTDSADVFVLKVRRAWWLVATPNCTHAARCCMR